MIAAKYGRSGRLFSLEISGHAGYAQNNDIVCASVSAVAYALLGYLSEQKDRHMRLRYKISKGYMLISVRAGGKSLSAVMTAFEIATTGLRQISEAYPTHVSYCIA